MAIVYCIVCNITGEKYYGSTIRTLSKRLSKHKRQLNCTSKQIILRGDYDIYKISEYETQEEALQREDWYIRNKECVNRQRVKLTDEDRKDYKKKYREKNIEEIKDYEKEYNEKNRERRKENSKEYYEKNRKEKVECEYCGFSIVKNNLKRHQRSQSCLTYQQKLK